MEIRVRAACDRELNRLRRLADILDHVIDGLFVPEPVRVVKGPIYYEFEAEQHRKKPVSRKIIVIVSEDIHKDQRGYIYVCDHHHFAGLQEDYFTLRQKVAARKYLKGLLARKLQSRMF